MSQPDIPHIDHPAVADAVEARRVRLRLGEQWEGTLDDVSDTDVVRLAAVAEAGRAERAAVLERRPWGSASMLIAGWLAAGYGLTRPSVAVGAVVGALLAFGLVRAAWLLKGLVARPEDVARLAREQGVPPRLPTADVRDRLTVTQAARRLTLPVVMIDRPAALTRA